MARANDDAHAALTENLLDTVLVEEHLTDLHAYKS